MKRHVLYVAAPACLLLGLPLAAKADIAPVGSASATAAQVGSLVGVSTTGAAAAPEQANAQASVLEVGGEPILGTGGSQSSSGHTGGALVDTGTALPARVEVAPWQAAATGSASDANRSSEASAAVARAEVPDLARAGVLQSESSAENRSTKSSGAGSSDAADVSLADIARLILLHSEVSSEGGGHSYLVGLNGTEIGTGEQLGGLCAADVGGLLSLSCLAASGGSAGGVLSGSAELLGLSSPLAAVLDPVSAFSATAAAGAGTVDTQPIDTGAAVEAARDISPAAAPNGTAGQAAAALPRTGVALASLAASALAAVLAGAVLHLLGRRRTTA